MIENVKAQHLECLGKSPLFHLIDQRRECIITSFFFKLLSLE
jgi:hypothetical protein